MLYLRFWCARILCILALTAVANAPRAAAQSTPTNDRLVLQQLPTTLASPTQALFPTAQGPIFAQLTSGAILRSDDAARTWRPETLPPLPNGAELRLVTVDHTGRAVAFARVVRETRPNPNPFAVQRDVSLYTFLRSRSGDATWLTVQPPSDPTAEVQAASPADPDVMYATTDAAERDNYTFSVWRSRDGGSTWESASSQRVYGACSMPLQPHPSDPQRVFSPGLACFGGLGGGAPSLPRFQESRDEAATWTDLFNLDKLRNLPFPKGSIYGNIRLVAGGMPPSPAALLAEIDYDPRSPGQGMGLLRSLDDGQTWTSVLQITPWDQALHPGAVRHTAYAIGTPVLDPRAPDTLVLSDGRLSDDGGKTWTGSPSLPGDVHPVMTPGGMLAATSTGVVRLQVVRQPVQLTESWHVLGSDFDQPSAISVAADGTLLVGDRGRVRRLSPDGQVLQELSARTDTPIDGIAQADQGQIYLADRAPHLDVLGQDGTLTTLRDVAGLYIGGVALDGAGNLYLTQRADLIPRDNPPQAVIVAAAADGSVQAQWGGLGSEPGEFGALNWGICLDGIGNVYVTDAEHNRVQAFAADGTLLQTFEGLHGPTGIALDSGGNLYVADTDANRIVELAPDGSQVASWGSWGGAVGQLWQPLGVAVDPTSGTIYVADTLNNRVVRIDRLPLPVGQGSG